MLQHEKYGYIPDQAQHGKAQAIDGGDAVNACKLQCNIYKYAMDGIFTVKCMTYAIFIVMHDICTIYNEMHDICTIYNDA